MIIMAILIIFILVGLQEAGSNAADEIADGKYDLDGNDGSECFNLPTVEIAYILDVKLVDKYLIQKSKHHPCLIITFDKKKNLNLHKIW